MLGDITLRTVKKACGQQRNCDIGAMESEELTSDVAEEVSKPIGERSLAVEAQLLQLVRRFCAGEAYAFDAFFELITPAIMPLVSRFVRNQEDAQDTVQEVAIQLYRSLPRFRQECKVSTFVYRITVNVCLNQQKRLSRNPSTFSELTSADGDNACEDGFRAASDTPEHLLLSRERQRMLHDAICSLSPAFRAVFLLADVNGMQYEEIAAIMHTSIGTVRSRLHRARTALQQIILANRELFPDVP